MLGEYNRKDPKNVCSLEEIYPKIRTQAEKMMGKDIQRKTKHNKADISILLSRKMSLKQDDLMQIDITHDKRGQSTGKCSNYKFMCMLT